MNKQPKLFKSQTWLTKEYKRTQRRLMNFLKGRATQTKQEKQMEKDLREIMEADFATNNPERKFRFEHIEALLAKHNIKPRPHSIMTYGKKNIGKTWALARLIREMRERNPKAQFVFVRNKQQDEVGMEQVFADEIWPVYMKHNKIYWKDSGGGRKRKKEELAGWFAWSTGGGFQSLQGSAYENVELIIWDECNDVDGNKLTPETLYKFYIFTSSIIRDKTNVRTYITGNLLSKQDDSMNIFLSRMHVDPEVKLKFIDIHKDNDPRKEIISRLLYINALDAYKGLESQKGLAAQFITEEEQDALISNLPRSITTKCIYSEHSFMNLIPMISIVFRLKELSVWTTYILYLAKKPYSYDYVIWIDPFSAGKIKPGYNPITNDRLIAGTHLAPMYIKDNPFVSVLKLIANLLQIGQLYFGYNNSLLLFTKIWEDWEPQYERGRELPKPLTSNAALGRSR